MIVMNDKRWNEVPGHENYLISEDGDVYSKHIGMLKKPTKNGPGYLRVTVRKDGKNVDLAIHRLVAEAFVPNPFNKPEVNHKDTNKANNKHTNLEWVTHAENMKHAGQHGRMGRKYK